MSRLLILSCSQRKRHDEGHLIATERYDGPTFRVLRRFFREKADATLTVYILSAEFGLIPGESAIPFYERRMTRSRAMALRPQVACQLSSLLRGSSWSEIGICLGRDYLSALCDDVSALPTNAQVSLLKGGLGKRLTALRN